MNKYEKEILSQIQELIPVGQQSYVDNIPLPQVKFKKYKGSGYILLYSEHTDKKYHEKMLKLILATFKREGIVINNIHTGPSYTLSKGNQLRFISTRMQLGRSNLVK